jgi:hypothetical protein
MEVAGAAVLRSTSNDPRSRTVSSLSFSLRGGALRGGAACNDEVPCMPRFAGRVLCVADDEGHVGRAAPVRLIVAKLRVADFLVQFTVTASERGRKEFKK